MPRPIKQSQQRKEAFDPQRQDRSPRQPIDPDETGVFTFEDMKIDQLRNRASELGILDYLDMSREELLRVLEVHDAELDTRAESDPEDIDDRTIDPRKIQD